MAAAPEHETTATLRAQIEDERARLLQILLAADQSRLSERPPNGKWSVIENVRHLLFAEQAHLGRFVEGKREWSPLGYTPQTMLRARKLDMDPAGPAFADVLNAWDAIHEQIRARFPARDDDLVRKALWTNLRHMRAHIVVIERLMRAQEQG